MRFPKPCRATRGYGALALKLLAPDGILVFCCCSGLITMDMIEDLLAQVSQAERREVQILEHGASVGPSGGDFLPRVQLS